MATTKEQVWTAADELAAEGKSPTLLNVRERLGGGSYTDISAAMQIWRANRQAAATPIREPAPTAIQGRLGELGDELWTIALELANARLSAEREALEQARQEAERIRQEAADLADQLAEDLDTARAEIRRQNEQLAAGTAEIERLRGEQRIQGEALTAAEHRAETSSTVRRELEYRIEELGRLLAKEQKARNKAEETAETRIEKVESARLAEQAAQIRLESAAREIEQLRKDKADADERARQAGAEAAELRGRLAAVVIPDQPQREQPPARRTRKPKDDTAD